MNQYLHLSLQQINLNNKYNNTTPPILLSKDEVFDIVGDFIEALGFNMNMYRLDMSNMNFNIDGYQICTFINKNNPSTHLSTWI